MLIKNIVAKINDLSWCCDGSSVTTCTEDGKLNYIDLAEEESTNILIVSCLYINNIFNQYIFIVIFYFQDVFPQVLQFNYIIYSPVRIRRGVSNRRGGSGKISKTLQEGV